MASEIMFRKHPLSGNFSDQTNELIDDVNKLNQIKKAAGLRGSGGPKEDWRNETKLSILSDLSPLAKINCQLVFKIFFLKQAAFNKLTL